MASAVTRSITDSLPFELTIDSLNVTRLGDLVPPDDVMERCRELVRLLLSV
jgi:hypothetical protein